jgi:hypothetical protein
MHKCFWIVYMLKYNCAKVKIWNKIIDYFYVRFRKP